MKITKHTQVEGWELDVSNDDEPRASAVEIAHRAGVKAARNVKTTVDKNRAELERHGAIDMRIRYVRTSMPNGGSKTVELVEPWLNEAQAITLVALLRTPAAADLRASLVRTFIAVRRGLTLTASTPVLATTAAIGDSALARRDVTAWATVAAKACGVSIHRVHGAVRRAHHAPGIYQVPLALLEHVKNLLQAFASGAITLPPRRPATLYLLQGGRNAKQTELFAR